MGKYIYKLFALATWDEWWASADNALELCWVLLSSKARLFSILFKATALLSWVPGSQIFASLSLSSNKVLKKSSESPANPDNVLRKSAKGQQKVPRKSLQSPQKVSRKFLKSPQIPQIVLIMCFKTQKKLLKKQSEIPQKVFRKSSKSRQKVLRNSSESPQKVLR